MASTSASLHIIDDEDVSSFRKSRTKFFLPVIDYNYSCVPAKAMGFAFPISHYSFGAQGI